MNLVEVQAKAIEILKLRPEFENLVMISQLSKDYNSELEKALRDPGVAIVFWNTEGTPIGDSDEKPILNFENSLVVAIVESREKNSTGIDALGYVQAVLKTLHFATYYTDVPGRKTFRVAKPAYVLGPIDTGIVTYFCHLRVKTLDTINAQQQC